VQTTFVGGSLLLDALATKLLADAARRQATSVTESARRVASWEEIELAVDDQGKHFLLLGDGEHWVAHGTISNHEVTVTGHLVDPLELHLVEIHDLEPYLTGSLTFLRTRG
jgi:hypothetical protein